MKNLPTCFLPVIGAAITLFSLSGCAAKTTLVYESKGDRQCEPGGQTALQSKDKLTSRGIDVIESFCGNKTGISMMTMCGAPTTHILLHRINMESEGDATALGFKNVSELSSGAESDGYIITSCEQ